jgi:hypothetical protein
VAGERTARVWAWIAAASSIAPARSLAEPVDGSASNDDLGGATAKTHGE